MRPTLVLIAHATLALLLLACAPPDAREERTEAASTTTRRDDRAQDFERPSATAEARPRPQTPVATAAAENDAHACRFEASAASVAASTVMVLSDRGHGTAFHLGGGEFITAEHVVRGRERVQLLGPGLDVTAVVLGASPALDVAILSAENALPALAWAVSTTSRSPRDWVSWAIPRSEPKVPR